MSHMLPEAFLIDNLAYAFVEAIVVTPMGALSVVICAILSHFFLKETLSLFGWLGCGLCIVRSLVLLHSSCTDRVVARLCDYRAEWSRGRVGWSDHRVPKTFSVTWLHRLWVRAHYRVARHYILLCTKVGLIHHPCGIAPNPLVGMARRVCCGTLWCAA